MTLFFASANKHKIREIVAMLPPQYKLLGLAESGIRHEIPETGSTIVENSFLKAKYLLDFLSAASRPGAVFADDSGLEVKALNNEPGVYSARYAGPEKNDELNNKKLLTSLNGSNDRSARFVTIITFLFNNEVHSFEGEIKGQIAESAKGNNGFGYDPLFIPEGYHQTFAELGDEIKNKISHRALAVKKFIKFLERL